MIKYGDSLRKRELSGRGATESKATGMQAGSLHYKGQDQGV
jgi:hypothetical protein